MTAWHYRWRIGVAGLLLLGLGLLSACGGDTSPATASSSATASPLAIPLVTNLPVPSPTPRSAQAADPALPGVSGMTGYELIASRVGEAIYSGYVCTIAPVGCACEIPILQRVVFTFSDQDSLLYTFAGDGFSAEWAMDRVGANQWSYTIPVYDNAGDFQGAFFTLLTFTQDGYILTQGADLQEGGLVSCPDVNFRRMRSATAPAP